MKEIYHIVNNHSMAEDVRDASLDEIERIAQAAYGWEINGPVRSDRMEEYRRDMEAFKTISAGPITILALISHIRELEESIDDYRNSAYERSERD